MNSQGTNSRLPPHLYHQAQRAGVSNPKQLNNLAKKMRLSVKKDTKPTIKSYRSIYEKVYSKRMRFYTHLSGIVAALMSLVVGLPFHRGFRGFIVYPVISILLWFGYFVLKKTRTATVTVEEPRASSKIQKIVSALSSSNSYILLAGFIFNSFLISAIIYTLSDSSLSYYIETATKTVKPFVNDNFSFMCFYTIASCLIYSIHFIIAEKYIIHIPIGTFRQEPIDYLRKLPHCTILMNSLIRSFFMALTIPLIYHTFMRGFFFQTFLKPLIIISGLNNQLPRSNFQIFTWLKVSFYSALTDLVYEILSQLFNAYALVGCLDVNKPLSHYSETPIQTLLSGLQDHKNPLVRVTAFQDLAYLLTSNDFQNRQAFYRADNWKLILSELFFILTNAARSARSDLPKLTQDDELKRERMKHLKKQSSIFGNLNSYKNNLDFDFDFEVNEVDLSSIPKFKLTSEAKIAARENGETFLDAKSDAEKIFAHSQVNAPEVSSRSDKEISDLLLKLNEKLVKGYQALNTSLKKYLNVSVLDESKSVDSQTKDLKHQAIFLVDDLMNLISQFMFGTIQEQSSKRIRNKEVVGFSIIALSEMLIHAKIEDKNDAVLSTLTDCLTILTKVYKGTSEFLMAQTIDISVEEFSIKEINEIALSYFFKVVIYYNSVLNDLLLPPEVFRLAQWCTDMALEQQREQKLTSNILS
jgi:nucleoporin NDC1